MLWFGRGLQRSSSPTPPSMSSEQGHLPLDQVAQSPIQPDLECFQGWSLHYLSGQPVPGFHHPHCKKCLPYIQSKSGLLWFKTITSCPVRTSLAERSALDVLKGCYKVSPQPSLLQTEQPQLSQPVLVGEVFQPSDHFCGLSLDPFQQVHVFPVLKAPELDAGLQVGSHQIRAEEGQNRLPQPAGHPAFDAAQDATGLLGCKCTFLAHVLAFHCFNLILCKTNNFLNLQLFRVIGFQYTAMEIARSHLSIKIRCKSLQVPFCSNLK